MAKGSVGDHLRVEEVARVLAQLHPRWRPLFATAIYTGLRKGELAALRREDVDLEARLLVVRRSWDRQTTKGGHADVVPIAPGGRPKGIREYREALEAADAPRLMIEVLLRGLAHEDIRVALEAYDRAAAYLYGRPGTTEAALSHALPYGLPTPETLAQAQRILMGEEEPEP